MEALDAGSARRLEQHLRAEDVRAEEPAGIDDGQAVVRFGGEVDDGVDLVLADHVLDDVQIGDVRLDERDVGPVEIGPVPGVRQEVERDDGVVGMTLEPVVHEVGADEAGRAGDEDPHGLSLIVIVVAALPAGPSGAADLPPLTLERLRPIEMRKRFVAAPEPDERGAEVVLRIRLVQLAAAPESRRPPAARAARLPRSRPLGAAASPGRSAPRR